MSDDLRKSTDKARDAERDAAEPFIIAGVAALLVALITVPVLVGIALFLPLRGRLGRPEWAVVGLTCLVGLLLGIGAYMRDYGQWLAVMVTGNGSRLDMPLLGLLLAGGLVAAIAGLVDGTRVTQSLPGILGRRDKFDRPSLIPTEKAKQRASTVAPPGGLTVDAQAHSITAPTPQGGRSFPIGIGMSGTPVMLSEREIGMHGIILGSTGSGKALALDTPIPTPLGWTTMGALRVGDFVLGEHGEPVRVSFATEVQHDRDCFEVEFSDGTVIVADADHRWVVTQSTAVGSLELVVTTLQLFKGDGDAGVAALALAPDILATNTSVRDWATGDLRVRWVTEIRPTGSVPVRCIQVDSERHVYLAGATMIPTHNTETIKSLAGSLLDLGWAGAILDLKEDTKAGGLRDFCSEYASAHGMLYQELCLSSQAPEYWFNPLSGMGPDEAQDSILSLLEFDDAYWQNLNRKMLAQTLRLHLAAHQVDPASFSYPTTFDIGRTLQQGARIPAATKKMRAALESVSPGSTRDPFDMMIQPTDDAAKSAAGFGMKLTNLYDTNAGKAVLLPSPGQQELDITRDGITYVGLDTLGKPDLTKIVSSSMLQRMSVYASQRTTGSAGSVKPRFLIIDEANWVNREIVMNLLSRARSAGICVFLCTQGPLDWVDKTGDDWARLTQNINVAIIMAQGEPKSAEVCADYLGTQEIMQVSRQIADGRMYDMGSAKMEVVHRVTPQQLREMTIGEAIIRVGKPTEWVSWMRVQQRRPDISPLRR